MLPLIPQDKANHFIYGCLIYFVLQVILTPVFALIATSGIAIAKEVYDKKSKKGTPEILDALYTIAGAIPLFTLEILSC